MKAPLIVIVGPTAVGKTELAVWLAERIGGEVVSADSRQIYRFMDIGTAKPSPEECRRVPHHMLDVAEPDRTLTLAEYRDLAVQAIHDILDRGRVPLLVGGTGLYVRAVAEGWSIPRVAPSDELRARLQARAEAEGPEKLHAELEMVDPEAARRIDARNVRRVVRALEVFYETGQTFSSLQNRQPPPYRQLWIGLTMSRQALYARADARIQRMLDAGWAQEVQSLLNRGYREDLPSFSALGYHEVAACVRGELDREATITLIRRHTRRFIRHQYAWFSLRDERIHWFNVTEPCHDSILALVGGFLEKQ